MMLLPIYTLSVLVQTIYIFSQKCNYVKVFGSFLKSKSCCTRILLGRVKNGIRIEYETYVSFISRPAATFNFHKSNHFRPPVPSIKKCCI